MKKALFIIPFIAFGGYFYNQNLPCKQPIHYSIGKVDPKFGVSVDAYTQIVDDASKVWENSLNKDLFVYDPNAQFKVNLVYDTRQATTEKNKILETNTDQTKQTASSVKAEYTALESTYATKKAEYSTLEANYTKREAAYNASVDYYNKNGGAPRSVYAQLTAEKANLKVLFSSLQTKRIELNSLATEINTKIGVYNHFVEAANVNINTINQSAGVEFEEGEYVQDKVGMRITIYEFTSKKELTRVLAHELGHALGMVHVENPDSIMYYLNKSSNLVPTAEDIRALKGICRIK